MNPPRSPMGGPKPTSKKALCTLWEVTIQGNWTRKTTFNVINDILAAGSACPADFQRGLLPAQTLAKLPQSSRPSSPTRR